MLVFQTELYKPFHRSSIRISRAAIFQSSSPFFSTKNRNGSHTCPQHPPSSFASPKISEKEERHIHGYARHPLREMEKATEPDHIRYKLTISPTHAEVARIFQAHARELSTPTLCKGCGCYGKVSGESCRVSAKNYRSTFGVWTSVCYRCSGSWRSCVSVLSRWPPASGKVRSNMSNL